MLTAFSSQGNCSHRFSGQQCFDSGCSVITTMCTSKLASHQHHFRHLRCQITKHKVLNRMYGPVSLRFAALKGMGGSADAPGSPPVRVLLVRHDWWCQRGLASLSARRLAARTAIRSSTYL